MKDEIKVAVQFLSRIILRNVRIEEDEKARFESCLGAILERQFTNHWFPENPTRGQGFRCLRINGTYRRDRLLEAACRQAGISYEVLKLPLELTLWVDPYEVTCRFGEDGTHQIVAQMESPYPSPSSTPPGSMGSTGSASPKLLSPSSSPSMTPPRRHSRSTSGGSTDSLPTGPLFSAFDAYYAAAQQQNRFNHNGNKAQYPPFYHQQNVMPGFYGSPNQYNLTHPQNHHNQSPPSQLHPDQSSPSYLKSQLHRLSPNNHHHNGGFKGFSLNSAAADLLNSTSPSSGPNTSHSMKYPINKTINPSIFLHSSNKHGGLFNTGSSQQSLARPGPLPWSIAKA